MASIDRTTAPSAFLTRLRRDQRASTAAMMGAAFLPTLLVLGLGIDVGRGYIVKSQLQTAVDSAVLAAAQSCKTDSSGATPVADPEQAIPQAETYFNDNFPENYLGTANRELKRDEMCTGPQFMRVRLTGQADMPFTLGKLAGLQPVTITATAAAESAVNPSTLETVLVLDVTGSMREALSGATRIDALKAAAKDFVDILYYNDETKHADSNAIGIVPYNTTVNMGSWATSRLGTTVKAVPGFTDQVLSGLNWTGCLENDDSAQDLSSTLTVQDPGAWDIRSEISGIASSSAPRLNPYHMKPRWVKNSLTADRANPTSDYYKAGTGVVYDQRYYLGTNLMVPGTVAAHDLIANSAAYREFFYEYYIGLNAGSGNAQNDVIVKTDGSYYPPGDPAAWKVDMRRVPYYWNPTGANIPYTGYPVSSTAFKRPEAYGPSALNTRGATNQCPASAMPIQYNRTRSTYKNWIDSNIVAHDPGIGTLHHAGLIWGYRMVQNATAFPRLNTTSKPAKRVLVFMTDGNWNSGANATGTTGQRLAEDVYTFYRTINDKRLTATATHTAIAAQSARRFAKVCQAAKDNGIAVYVVALAIEDPTSDALFQQCAPGKYKKAATAAELRQMFQEIAREVIDLHISK